MARLASVSLATAVLLAGGGATQAAGPNLSGVWRLDPKRSDDVRAQIDAAAGPNQVTGGGASGFTILPESNTRSEVERVEMREWMMGVAEQLDRLEIQQTGDEVKLYLGEDNVRIFYLNRESTREDGQGRKLKCRARLEGDRLVLEEHGEKGTKMHEAFTLEPHNGWLIHALRFENRLLKQPLELRLLYVKDKP
jgi:hypothetical protein